MAAPSATDQSVEQVNKVQLRVMVDKERNKIVYAEAGKDFIDVLLSFFTLPLGTIARLVSKESNIEAVNVGSLSTLYQSVTDIDEQYLLTPTCKEMLLNPRNSMEEYCKKLKLNIDNTEPMEYFRCATWECNSRDSGSCLSSFRNQKCTCGKVMDTQVFPKWSNLENGFVKETSTFIISDDLILMPNVCATIVSLLQKLGVDNIDTIQEQTVNISKEEVIDLLKLTLLSKTPLTDFVFMKKEFLGYSNPRLQSDFGIGNMVSTNDGRRMDLKVMTRKSNAEILFAEVEEDFVDFLFSFLTFPLGGVFHMLDGFISLGCLNNLYQSMKELNLDRYLISPDLTGKLAKSQIAPQFDLSNQILPIDAASLPVFYCHTRTTCYKYCTTYFVNLTKDMVHSKSSSGSEKCVQFSFVDPRSSCPGEFVKRQTTYLVTDELVVTPMSATSAISYMKRSKVPLSDMKEVVITIGMKEGLALVKASLISPTALTTGLNQFIRKIKDPVKKAQENLGWGSIN